MNTQRITPALTALLALLLLTPTLRAEDRVTQPFLGILLHEITYDKPRHLVIRVAEIDLTAKGISFLVTPSNGDPNGDEPGDPNLETTRQTTLDFLNEQNAQLAINASFFKMGVTDTDNVGLVVSRGEQVSPFRGDWTAINIAKNNTPTIIHGNNDTFDITSPPTPPDSIQLYNAITGSDQIVTDGKPIEDQPDRKFFTTAHPRTAIGITNHNTLLLVTVDGRQPGFSEGIPLNELAQLMIELGAVNALNLDGGGSTTMTIADPEPRVLNFPSSKDEEGNPGVLRKNGTNLAVFAIPNPDYQHPE
jgi:exopolysaccharide biosynthesis protein